MRITTLLLALFSLAMFSCKEKSDMEKIEDYLTENNLIAEQTASGVYYIITKEGAGGHPNLLSNVTVKYKGYLLNGEVFDETTGSDTATFPLQGVIEGWQIAIPLLQRGGKGTFFIPSHLGYGSQSVPGIPRNSVLVFDVELINF
jgi:FKBP-type peptidyl-prolyl cis-trans isomerase FkpA